MITSDISQRDPYFANHWNDKITQLETSGLIFLLITTSIAKLKQYHMTCRGNDLLSTHVIHVCVIVPGTCLLHRDGNRSLNSVLVLHLSASTKKESMIYEGIEMYWYITVVMLTASSHQGTWRYCLQMAKISINCLIVCCDTVRCRYLAVIFFLISHEIHYIVHP